MENKENKPLSQRLDEYAQERDRVELPLVARFMKAYLKCDKSEQELRLLFEVFVKPLEDYIEELENEIDAWRESV